MLRLRWALVLMGAVACVACTRARASAGETASADDASVAERDPSTSERAQPAPATAPAASVATGLAPAKLGGEARAAGDCGPADSGCPLRAWMKANAARALQAGDFVALGEVLARLADFAPPGYANWASISRDGADAARVEDLRAVEAACRGCHRQYNDRYRREMRDRPL